MEAEENARWVVSLTCRLKAPAKWGVRRGRKRNKTERWIHERVACFCSRLILHGKIDVLVDYIYMCGIAQEEPISSSDDGTPTHAAYLFVGKRVHARHARICKFAAGPCLRMSCRKSRSRGGHVLGGLHLGGRDRLWTRAVFMIFHMRERRSDIWLCAEPARGRGRCQRRPCCAVRIIIIILLQYLEKDKSPHMEVLGLPLAHDP